MYKQHPTKLKPQTPLTLTLSTYITFEQPNKNSVDDDKYNPETKLYVLNWHNQNPNTTTIEKLTVLLQ
jgi:hypothetical protein